MLRQERITALIKEKLNPTFLTVENESSQHSVPKDSETHFKITAVSEAFLGLPPLKRHRLLNTLLANELQNGLHALSLHLFTQEEWLKRSQSSPPSPACKGGMHREKK
ncbi:MAG: BolA family protein [Tatlockia sp.]|jgi:BolA protein